MYGMRYDIIYYAVWCDIKYDIIWHERNTIQPNTIQYQRHTLYGKPFQNVTSRADY